MAIVTDQHRKSFIRRNTC